MKKAIIFTAIVMACTLPAAADFKTVSRAYELEPSLVNVPATPGSRMTFSECDGCGATAAQLTARTRFSVNGKNVEFADFRNALKLAQQSDRSGVVLQHHLESNAVVYISVSL